MIYQDNLFSDFGKVLKNNDGEISVQLINRRIIHPSVKVIGNSSPKENEDGVLIYVGRYKQPYFIPLQFNNGFNRFSQTNEDTNIVIDYSIDRSNWVNKLDFINFGQLKYVESQNNTRDINWCNPDFANIVKNVVNDWEIYCSIGRTQNSNNKNVNKIYPTLLLGYMGRKDGKLDSGGHVLGTPSKGHGHKTGTAIDMNFQNNYDDYDNIDDYTIEAVAKFFDICKNRGVKAIGYIIKDKYKNRLNDIYKYLPKHENHFHVSATDMGKESL